MGHYNDTAATLFLLFVFCWMVPNCQQLFSRYNPVLQPVQRRPWFRITLDAKTGLIMGILAYLLLRSSFITEPSPFIYFKF